MKPSFSFFGKKQLPVDDKIQQVEQVFSSVASRYDLMNDLMSFGLHHQWKQQFIRLIDPTPQDTILDSASGTGDIGYGLYEYTQHQATLVMADLTSAMLKLNQERFQRYHRIEPKTTPQWVVSGAEQLPFESNHFSLYTISFGLRNVGVIDQVLQEAYRVLKPKGRMAIMEFSPHIQPSLQGFYNLYKNHLIPRLGQAVVNDKASYQYFAESIDTFLTNEALKARLEATGFTSVQQFKLTFGVVTIHMAYKHG